MEHRAAIFEAVKKAEAVFADHFGEHNTLEWAAVLELRRALSLLKDGIETSFVYPPIPVRQFDWCAYRDPEVTPYGYGRTEAEAIADLLDLEAA